MSEIKHGQIWREVDQRFSRHVRIVTLLDHSQKAVIHTVNPKTGEKCGPFTQAKLERFNGKRAGYELVTDA
ncbi:hypothetical protein [Caballeronia sp. INSB1]|uniref:hypothetical protein n=1 Tax=Caballeronia sp. INSB1 TaxID=2921751 RepID=UPI00203232B1|nr:hypothetical protein [Caballeronia sp. INSB1]